MPRLVITVDEESYQRLVARAVDSRRDTRDEAALLVERAVRKSARPLTACPERPRPEARDGR